MGRAPDPGTRLLTLASRRARWSERSCLREGEERRICLLVALKDEIEAVLSGEVLEGAGGGWGGGERQLSHHLPGHVLRRLATPSPAPSSSFSSSFAVRPPSPTGRNPPPDHPFLLRLFHLQASPPPPAPPGLLVIPPSHHTTGLPRSHGLNSARALSSEALRVETRAGETCCPRAALSGSAM